MIRRHVLLAVLAGAAVGAAAGLVALAQEEWARG